jgi:hypothetical protein
MSRRPKRRAPRRLSPPVVRALRRPVHGGRGCYRGMLWGGALLMLGSVILRIMRVTKCCFLEQGGHLGAKMTTIALHALQIAMGSTITSARPHVSRIDMNTEAAAIVCLCCVAVVNAVEHGEKPWEQASQASWWARSWRIVVLGIAVVCDVLTAVIYVAWATSAEDDTKLMRLAAATGVASNFSAVCFLVARIRGLDKNKESPQHAVQHATHAVVLGLGVMGSAMPSAMPYGAKVAVGVVAGVGLLCHVVGYAGEEVVHIRCRVHIPRRVHTRFRGPAWFGMI